jgi:helix-turn-helix protein
MEALKHKISDNHDNAVFYSGVVAYGLASNGKTYVLRNESIPEMEIDGISYAGEELESKAKRLEVDDYDEDSILVDGWLVISEVNGMNFEDVLEHDEDRVYDSYDDAIEAFKLFLL